MSAATSAEGSEDKLASNNGRKSVKLPDVA